MHILMVAPEQIPVPGGGSVEICMLAIAKELARHHKVTLVSRQLPRLRNFSFFGNLTIVRVPSKGSNVYISSVLEYIRGKKYDLIQVDNRPHYMATVKAAFPNTPVCLFLHSLTFVPLTSRAARSMDKADMIIANSGSLKTNLIQRFPEQAHKIRKVHLGVDVSRFKPPSALQKQRLKKAYNLGNGFTILFAGRVIPRKGVPVLIKATELVRKKISGVNLVIVGTGRKSYLEQLRSQAGRLNVSASFIGKVPHTKIHRLFKMADCFVCPSQRHESFGLVNIEALASGVPVVASRIGGIKEIVKPGVNGYLVDRYTHANGFAYYLTKIAKDAALAKRLAAQGRKDVLRRFVWKLTAAKLIKLYRSLIVSQ